MEMEQSVEQELRSYLGNSNLLLAGEKYQYTQWEIQEIAKCQADLDYFVENYVKIIHVDQGLINFEPWPYQKKTLDTIRDNRFVICKFPRQSGKSTTVVAYILWYILFTPNAKVAILANRADTARDLFGKVRLSYEYLPKFLQAGIAPGGWNKGSIVLGNGSMVKADSTSGSSIRGGTFNLLFLDEFAFVDNNLADEFFKSVYPTISSGKTTKVIIVSTPKGTNHFFEMWDKAINGQNEFVPIEINWNDVPGRDEAWKEIQIKNIGIESWNQEFECQFLGSSNTLIDAENLKRLKACIKNPIHVTEQGLAVYEDPRPGYKYAITVDPSRGQGLDYHAFSVFDVTNLPYKQVARFRNNKIYPTILPTFIKMMAEKYNEASVLVEISDNGQQIADMLIGDLDTDNVIRVRSNPGRGGQTVAAFAGTGRINNGLKTSPATKRIGCTNLKTLIESDKLKLVDGETIQELFTFIADNQSFAADEGYNDDLAMTLVLFAWLSHQRYFRHEQKDIRQELEEQYSDYLESQMTPLGVFDDGISTFSVDY